MDRRRDTKRDRAGRSGARSGRGAPSGRRTPPPASTGHEADFFESAKRSATPLVLMLTQGKQLRGTVTSFGRDHVTVDTPSGSVVVRKIEIRYLYADD